VRKLRLNPAAQFPAIAGNFIAPMLRVSTTKQADKWSLPVQDEFLTDLIARENFARHPDITLEDDGYEGDDWNRPGIRKAIELIRQRVLRGLAFLDTDRFARDVHGGLGFLKEVNALGGVVLFGDLGRYRDDAEFQLQLTIKLSIGQYAKAKTKGLSRMSALKRSKSGNVQIGGLRLYGYTTEYVNGVNTLKPIPSEIKVVQWIFERRVARWSLRQIARALKARGVPPPRKNWNPETIAGILRNETYAGVWHYNKTRCVEPDEDSIPKTVNRHRRRSSQEARDTSEWIPIAVEPVVDRASFEEAKRLAETAKAAIGGRPSDRYLLKGLVFCDNDGCTKRWCGKLSGNGHTSYGCTNRDRTFGNMLCQASGISAKRLEAAVIGAVREYLGNEQRLGRLIETHRASLQRSENADEAAKLKARIEPLQRRAATARAGILRAAEAGDEEGQRFYENEEREARSQRAELEGELRRLTRVTEIRVDMKTLAAQVRERLDNGSRTQLQIFLRAIIHRIRITGRDVVIEFRIPLAPAAGSKSQPGGNCQKHLGISDSFIPLKVKVRAA